MVMDNIKDQVREYIYSGASAPDTILSERDIAEQFNMKRGNIREILLTLEGEGVVNRIPQKGYSYVNYAGTDFEMLSRIRYTIEFEALNKVMHGAATREDLIRLTLLAEDLERYAGARDLDKFSQTDLAFHTALIEASHDNLLIRLFGFLCATVFRLESIQERIFDEKFEETQESHRELFQAIKESDWKAASQALWKHLGGGFRDIAFPAVKTNE